MTYKIKLICDEVEGFVREIEIDSDATFLDLNKAILASCNYPDDQMTSFYICDDDWRQGAQVTREDMGAGSADEDIYLMEKTVVGDLIEDEGQRLEYVFDPFSDRLFFMEVVEAVPGKHLDTPEVIKTRGKAPRQIEELDFSMPTTKGTKSVGAVDDDDIYGFDGPAYNDDELDMEGFEITDGSNF